MKEISVRQATANELEWINKKYDEVKFVNSDYLNEFIVIAAIEETKVGLGRLVKIDQKNIELGGIYVFPEFRGFGVANRIVATLLEENPYKDCVIWCLPFENLLRFYLGFGFKQEIKKEIPPEVNKKLEWCNTGAVYEHKVRLLCIENI